LINTQLEIFQQYGITDNDENTSIKEKKKIND